jgi:hypothetical protein
MDNESRAIYDAERIITFAQCYRAFVVASCLMIFKKSIIIAIVNVNGERAAVSGARSALMWALFSRARNNLICLRAIAPLFLESSRRWCIDVRMLITTLITGCSNALINIKGLTLSRFMRFIVSIVSRKGLEIITYFVYPYN